MRYVPQNKKYRFTVIHDSIEEKDYKIFESRYYAQKYIKEICSQDDKEIEYKPDYYSIESYDDGFIICACWRVVL